MKLTKRVWQWLQRSKSVPVQEMRVVLRNLDDANYLSAEAAVRATGPLIDYGCDLRQRRLLMVFLQADGREARIAHELSRAGFEIITSKAQKYTI